MHLFSFSLALQLLLLLGQTVQSKVFNGSATFNDYPKQVAEGDDVACDCYKNTAGGKGLPSEQEGIFHAAINDYAPDISLGAQCYYEEADQLAQNGPSAFRSAIDHNWFVHVHYAPCMLCNLPTSGCYFP